MTPDSRKFLQPEAIARVARLELRARLIVEGFLSGLHRSPYFGQSVEFVQHREYVPGDDFRRIDWKAWSKTDKFYVKQYEEDTNLRCTILLDVSESMQFGTQPLNKFEYAASVAVSLAHLLLQQQDAVGLTTFDSSIRSVVPQRTSRGHLQSIIEAIAISKPHEKTDLFDILKKVAEAQTQRGLIVVLSDLLVARESLFEGLRMLRHRNHDVLLLHIMDDAELDFDFKGTTRFEGLEAAGDLTCDPRSLRDGYLAALNQYLEELRKGCARETIDMQTLRTSEYLDAALAYFLNHRIGKSRKSRR